MEVKPNDRQVGGSHYQSVYQHWDLVVNTSMHYLLACATKYVARHRKKNGKQDLEKAVHYTDKFIETYVIHIRERGCRPRSDYVRSEAVAFCAANTLVGDERQAIMHLTCWDCKEDLYNGKAAILRLIGEYDAAPQLKGSLDTHDVTTLGNGRLGYTGTPKEDSNKHAFQE